MTILIGYRFNDRVLFVADRLRVKIDDHGNVLSQKNSVEKVRIVRPSIAIATAGLGSLGDAVVTAIRFSICDPIKTPNYSADETIKCCQDHFRFLHTQFAKYNPEAYNVMVFLLGGVDPKTKQSFLYSFESSNNFTQSENLQWIVRGPHKEETEAKNIIASQLERLEYVDHNTLPSIFAETIKTVSVASDSVGSDCRAVLVGDFPYLTAEF